MKLQDLVENAEETSMGDFIISEFEAGKLTYQQAKGKLVSNDLGVYIHELTMADELKKDAGTTHH